MQRLRIVSLLSAAALPAQTVIVDATGGAGSQFTSIAAAVAAVPDGATVIVRPGNYPGVVSIDGKGLAILADPGVSITSGAIVIQNTQPAQANRLLRLNIASIPVSTFPFPQQLPIVVDNCQGRVVIEQCTASPSPAGPLPTSGPPNSLHIGGSFQVALRQCTFITGVTVFSSHVVAEDCDFTGRNARFVSLSGSWQATPAVEFAGGSLQLVRSTLRGGRSDGPLGSCSPTYPNQPGLTLNGGIAVVRRSGSIAGGDCGTPAAAVTGVGTLRVDPAVATPGALLVSPAPLIAAMPTAQGTGAGLGGTITGRAEGPAGDLVILVLGLPGPTLSLPGFDDAFWLDVAGHSYAAVGATSPQTAAVAVPVVATLRGFELAWQTVTWNPTAGFSASQPSLVFVY